MYNFNYIVSNYEFRFNVVTSNYEFRKLIKGRGKGDWLKFNDRVKNRILVDMLNLDLELSQDKFNLFIE